jgi:hypothetical protein
MLCALCLLAGLFPGFVIDALAQLNLALLGQRMPTQTGLPWLSIVPIGESRSSYNGLLIFFFILVSAGTTALVVRHIASNALRRAPAWDCGFPDPSPNTQYTASSFAQPIRRVYGSLAFSAEDHVHMPAPGSTAAATFHVTLRDHIWEVLYETPGHYVMRLARRLNVLQFLTIRRYLILMFIVLVSLLIAVTVAS